MKVSKDALRTARQLLRATLVEGRIEAGRARQIVAKLGEMKPRGYHGILSAYSNLIRLELAERHAVVESAVELEGGTRDRITSELKGAYGDDLTFDFVVNPDLLGGMRVKVGSDVWDGSVRARLQQLRESFAH